MFVTYTCKTPDSPNIQHDGNTVTILKCISPERQTYIVSRYNSVGSLVRWGAHISELNNFDGVV